MTSVSFARSATPTFEKVAPLVQRAEESFSDQRVHEIFNRVFETHVPPQREFGCPAYLAAKMLLRVITFIPKIFFVALTECVIGVLFGLVSPLSLINLDPEHPKIDRPAILLLHGYKHNQVAYAVGRQFLKKENYGSVYSMNYAHLLSNDATDSIDDYGLKVKNKIEEITKATGQRVIVIGHSMGGLVTASAVRQGANVSEMITLGTPWRGAPLAGILPLGDLCADQMAPGSDFVNALRANTEGLVREGRLSVTTLNSLHDELVPHSRTSIEGATRSEHHYFGHLGILVSPWIWWDVQSRLDQIYARV